jgi:uncharacterized protein YjbJ (UPF0337 family)
MSFTPTTENTAGSCPPVYMPIYFAAEEPIGRGGYNGDIRTRGGPCGPVGPGTAEQIAVQQITQENPMNRQIIKGDWDIAKGKLKKKYASLTDDDLRYVEGQEDELIGRLEKRTGAAREELERFLHEESKQR